MTIPGGNGDDISVLKQLLRELIVGDRTKDATGSSGSNGAFDQVSYACKQVTYHHMLTFRL